MQTHTDKISGVRNKETEYPRAIRQHEGSNIHAIRIPEGEVVMEQKKYLKK